MHAERGLPPLDRARLRAVFRAARSEYPSVPSRVSLALVGDLAITAVHADAMGDATPTDVLAFDLRAMADLGPEGSEREFEAEIVIGVETAVRAARRLGRRLPQEVELYLAHGLLHLAGFDDHAPKERARMRRAERRVLAAVASKRPSSPRPRERRRARR